MFGSARQRHVRAAAGADGHQHRPNTNGLPGINQLRTIVGAVMTIGLILSVRADRVRDRVGLRRELLEPHLASRGKVGVLVSWARR